MNIPDRFLHFTYNGVHSSEFGVFYTNDGEDLFFPFSLNYKHNTNAPLYQGYDYLLGSSVEGSTFSLSLAVDNQTVYSTQEIFNWLNPGQPGELIFDFMPNYKYPVLISRIDHPTTIPREHPNGMIETILMFNVNFTTYKDHVSETVKTYTLDKAFEGEILEPDVNQIMMFKKGDKISFINLSTVDQSFKINLASKDVLIQMRDRYSLRTYYKYNLKNKTTSMIDTKIGAIVTRGSLIESVYPQEIITNEGPMVVKPSTVFSGPADLVVNGSNIEVSLNSRFKDLGQPSSFALVTEMKMDKNTETVYEDGSKGGAIGVYPKNKALHPVYLLGTRKGDKLIFPNDTKNPLREGVQKIKIAAVTQIDIAAEEYLVEFNYKKGV